MKYAWVLAMAVVMACLVGPRLESCGPFPIDMLFTTYHGVLPAELESGQVGVLRPHFYRRDLLLAYRTLSGLQPAGARAAGRREATAASAVSEAPRSPVEAWMDARKAITPVPAPKEVRTDKKVPGADYEFFQNCLGDAFVNAATTLSKRVAQWGAGSANVAEWVRGQDQVFQNCPGGEAIPKELTAGDPLLAADRRYQIAAAEFYAGKFEEAAGDFDRIAKDAASPWHEIAPYLAARACIRQGTFEDDDDKMAEATERLRGLLKNAALRERAQALLDFVRARTEPQHRLVELGKELMQPNAGPRLERVITDYTWICDHLEESSDEAPAEKSDVVEWIKAFQAREPAIAEWRAKRTMPWLVAALVAADVKDPAGAELVAAAHAVPASSPAWASVTYWGIRRQILAGDPDAARKWAEQALAAKPPVATANLLRAERLKVAQDWTEFLRFAARTPAAISFIDAENPASPDDMKKKPAAFDKDAATQLDEHVPLSLWADAVKNDLVPRNLQADLAQAGWVRAVLLKDAATARTMAARTAELRPELAGEMKTYLDAQDAAAARFAAVFLMLRGPGFEPVVRAGFDRGSPVMERDMLRDNWWSLVEERPDGDRDANHEALYDLYLQGEMGPEGFLSKEQRAAGEAEWKVLAESAGNSVNFLAGEAIAWAQAHPQDPQVPEALHQVVEATHFGPADGKKSKEYSKQAFDILHRRYPNSEWTRKTKYWY